MTERWTKEQAWEWYTAQPWIRGFNYVPSDCSGWVQMWEEHDHAEKVETFKRELALAGRIGFNAVRQFLGFNVWLYQHDSFMANVEEYISIAAENGLKVMLVLISDGAIPEKKPLFGQNRIPARGYDAPEISGIFPSREEWPQGAPTVSTQVKFSPVDEPELAEKFYCYVDELASRYAKDERILLWNVWNEPGNSNRGIKSVPHMKKAFEIIRSHDPIQPLAADIWRFPKDHILFEEEALAAELSDVISYHDYGPYEYSVRVIDMMREFGRPMLNTEWLHRVQYNNVGTHLPLYYNNGIGIFNWGFVVGKSRTSEPWEGCWKRYAAGEKLDISRWQHHLLRANLRPYDPEEIQKIMMYAQKADEAFARKGKSCWFMNKD